MCQENPRFTVLKPSSPQASSSARHPGLRASGAYPSRHAASRKGKLGPEGKHLCPRTVPTLVNTRLCLCYALPTLLQMSHITEGPCHRLVDLLSKGKVSLAVPQGRSAFNMGSEEFHPHDLIYMHGRCLSDLNMQPHIFTPFVCKTEHRPAPRFPTFPPVYRACQPARRCPTFKVNPYLNGPLLKFGIV